MTGIRVLFCDAVDAITALVGDTTLLDRFDEPSVLAEFSVRGLAGHLLRAVTSAEGYLDGPEPEAGPNEAAPAAISAAEYYATVAAASTGVDDDFNRAIRQRGLEAAPGLPEEFPAAWVNAAGRIRVRLAAESPGRLVRVYGDLVLTLDEYLVTRLLELVVHADDLALSLGIAPPPLPPAATGVAIATLVEVARRRHGDTAVLRALTRRERDDVAALRVL